MPVRKSDIENEAKKPDGEISIIKLVDWLIQHAYDTRTSDIHLDPAENALNVRFRIDGILHEVFSFPKSIHDEVVSRLKVLSGLRTDEHRATQDGRIKFSTGKKEDDLNFDVRLSIIPTYHGENAVMRLLAKKGAEFEVETIDLSERDLKLVKDSLGLSYGMVLVTGPTGSGKTTTLYTALKRLNTPERAIITIEDPIEYSLEGVNQIQVNNETGLTFARGLRSILRQDPNIVMVGEIRDEETAAIAVNAALTGHLLFSTLHTNDAPTTLPRLLDMKVEPFLIASTVNIAIGQRLLRKICEHCKKEKKLSITEWRGLKESLPPEVELSNKNFYYGAGCKECGMSGYEGRVAIYEVLEVSPAIREAITARKSAADIKQIAMKEGMTTMIQDAFMKASRGITTIEEILRVIHE